MKDEVAVTKEVEEDSDPSPGWVYTLTNLAKDEALHRMQVLADLGIFPNLVTKARSVLSQKYSGDITILPAIEYKDFPRMLKNPTSDFMVEACLRGERATWPKLSRIRNHCAIELELDAAVQALRARVVFSPSQVDLRRMTTGSYAGAFPIPLKRGGRERRDSSGNLHALRTNIAEEPTRVRKSVSRPPRRTASTYWLQGSKRHLPAPTRPRPRSEHGTPLITSNPEENPFKFPTDKTAFEPNAQIPDISSAGETTHSPLSGSDADIDSLTEESSPESNLRDELPGLGLYYSPSSHNRYALANLIDFFSTSQPITPKTDHILATSPATSRVNIAITPSPVTREKKPGENKNMATPSSPESRYKNPFHPPQDQSAAAN